MAQDYDSPRNKDEDEESLQALGKNSQNSAADMDWTSGPSSRWWPEAAGAKSATTCR